MSRYDWLLFLHVLAAFAIVAGLTLLAAALLLVRREPADTGLALALTRFSPILFDAAGLLVLVLGVWLAIDVERYELWDAWIVAALVLWVVIAFSGARALGAFRRARRQAVEVETGDLAAAIRAGRAPLYTSVAVAATLATLVLMIFKPGA